MTENTDYVKVTENYLQFKNARLLKDFVSRYTPGGESFEFEFLEPVKAGGNEVYIPAGALVNPGRLEHLDQYDGNNEYYRIKNSENTLVFYVRHLRKQFARLLKQRENDFLMTLFEGISGNSIGGIITHALYDKRRLNSSSLTLWLLRIFEQDQELFEYLALTGLYALGTAYAIHRRHSYLYRDSFQMGLVVDMNARQEKLLNESLFNRSPDFQRQFTEQAADAGQRLGLTREAVQAIRSHLNENEIYTDETPATSNLSLFDEPEPVSENKAAEEESALLERDLLATMRVARYFVESEKSSKDLAQRFQSIVGGLAYLSEKKLLPTAIAKPILRRCHKYKSLIIKMTRIAQLEEACLVGDSTSAWAYPKPDATQVLCLNHHTECANFLSGRPIFVVGLSEANLQRFARPGEYNKCKLAEKLPR
ncbi:MAG: hypothetical protein KDK39_06585 [Leptospiraceae bacterium]|nr:hypothetical protein [Leptospiraceae bacterium]